MLPRRNPKSVPSVSCSQCRIHDYFLTLAFIFIFIVRLIRFRITQHFGEANLWVCLRMLPDMSDCRDSGYSLRGWKPGQSKKWKRRKPTQCMCIACLCFHTFHDVNNFCHRHGRCGGLPEQLEASTSELNSVSVRSISPRSPIGPGRAG